MKKVFIKINKRLSVMDIVYRIFLISDEMDLSDPFNSQNVKFIRETKKKHETLLYVNYTVSINYHTNR